MFPAPPKPAPETNEPQLQITTTADGKAHLRIPKSMLVPIVKFEKSDSGISPAHTVVAGIALSAALAVSGLLFARRRSEKTLLLMAVVGTVGVISTIATADLPFAHGPRPPRPVPNGVTMPVLIEITDDVGLVQLTVPAPKAALLAQQPTTKPSR